MVQDLVAGRVDSTYRRRSAIVPQYQAKQLKILAVSAPERLKGLPEIPTLNEKGVDFVRFGWLGICAGAGTPQPIVDLLQPRDRRHGRDGRLPRHGRKGGLDRGVFDAGGMRQVIAQTLDDVASTIREFGMQQE